MKPLTVLWWIHNYLSQGKKWNKYAYGNFKSTNHYVLPLCPSPISRWVWNLVGNRRWCLSWIVHLICTSGCQHLAVCQSRHIPMKIFTLACFSCLCWNWDGKARLIIYSYCFMFVMTILVIIAFCTVRVHFSSFQCRKPKWVFLLSFLLCTEPLFWLAFLVSIRYFFVWKKN